MYKIELSHNELVLIYDLIDVLKEEIKHINRDGVEFDKKDIRKLTNLQNYLKEVEKENN